MIYDSFLIIDIIIVFLAVVISISLHEFSHALAAYWNGDYTAKANGRMTLNPVRHFDLVGFLMLMLVGFGYAKPVPVNPNNFKKKTLGIFTVAIAGIVTNLLLAFFSTVFCLLFIKLGTNVSGFSLKIADFFASFFDYMVVINVSLALFNLLPLYPLDGFRIVEAFTRFMNPVTKFLRDYGQYILFALIGIHIIIDSFNLVNISGVFEYFDLLGLYMNHVGGGIQKGFRSFWRLMIK